jgi:hypothetical protein
MTRANGGGRAALRPRARLVRALGDELISSESVAVTELVKNAYDADATAVLLRFMPPTTAGEGGIELIDNGHGMSPQTLSEAFLQPATPFRRSRPRTKGQNRRVLGEKGIGRFAVSRLADRLAVSTREPGAEIETRLDLDWGQFDDDAKFLDEIEVEWEVSPPTDFARQGAFERLALTSDATVRTADYHGTILRMESLRRDWEQADFESLRKDLSRLVSPFAREIPPMFQVYLELPEEHRELSGPVSPPEFLLRPHYRIVGHVRKDGQYNLEATLRGRDEQIMIEGAVSSPNGTPFQCGPFEIELRVWDRDRDALAPLVEQRGGTLTSLREELDDFAGISIYRDGFRVLPYGEQRNDWLRLDLRRVQNPTLRLSNNQIAGYITISSDENKDLRDQSNREGLLQNAAYEDLERAVLMILGEIETRRLAGRRKTRARRPTQHSLFGGMDLSDLQEAVREHAPKDRELQDMVAARASDLRSQVREIQEVLSRYHRLATLGQLVDTIVHDGRAPLGKIRVDVKLALAALAGKGGSRGRARKRLAEIDGHADTLGQLFDKIAPFGGRRRGRPKEIVIEDVARTAVSLLDTDIERDGITVHLPTSRTRVTVNQAELQSVIYNLAANSIYWLATLGDGGERVLTIDVKRLPDGHVEILVADSGPGVDQEFAEQIFEPYFSTKPSGTGLGLTHAGEIVSEYYNGKLELLAPDDAGGATFRVTLGYRV